MAGEITKLLVAWDRTARDARASDGLRIALNGLAGTGKSYTLACVVRALAAAGVPYALLCPTWLAATALDAQLAAAGVASGNTVTLHTYFGVAVYHGTARCTWSPDNDPHDHISRIDAPSVLIIDEASMVCADDWRCIFMSTLETASRVASGGAYGAHAHAILVSGDTHQLPPVGGNPSSSLLAEITREAAAGAAGVRAFELRDNYRARSDPAYAAMLAIIADGRPMTAVQAQVHTATGPDDPRLVAPSTCYVAPTNRVVGRLNRAYVTKHGGDTVSHFPTLYMVGHAVGASARLLGATLECRRTMPEEVVLCVGAPVEYQRIGGGHAELWNGRRGVVQGIRTTTGHCYGTVCPDGGSVAGVSVAFPAVGPRNPALCVHVPYVVRTMYWHTDGRAATCHVPLRCAAAGTVHGVQGITIANGVCVYVARSAKLADAAPGEVYVALSRTTRGDQTLIVPWVGHLRRFLARCDPPAVLHSDINVNGADDSDAMLERGRR